ncbi:four-helix bundle copper-binding protein [Bosea sp. (in: a-proteobacteria)]
MHHPDPKTREIVDLALDCYKHCFGMATTHCLAVGGAHAEPGHLTLMLACSEICRSMAHLLLMASPHARHLAPECIEICEACAADCERLGGMEDCVAACRACAKACAALS